MADLQDPQTSPPQSTSSSPSSSAADDDKPTSSPRTPLSLDLSSLPPLIQPTPPSNTLLITDLNSLSIFHPASLATIRHHIASICPIHSFAPLKSFRRIVCSFYTIDDAIRIRQLLDGEAILPNTRARVYFGEPTPIEPIAMRYLEAPQSQKLFFISPPPSPPHGWEMRNEEPPNKEVHAGDLAEALAKLHARPSLEGEPATPVSPTTIDGNVDGAGSVGRTNGGCGFEGRGRSGSSTVTIYNPEDHGDSPNLPAVMVEDTTAAAEGLDGDEEEEMELSPIDGDGNVEGGRRIIAHTSRPPVELMDQS